MNGMTALDAIENLQGRVESGAYDIKIIKELGLDDYKLRLITSQPMKTKLLKVSLQQDADRTEVGQKILAKLLDVLGHSYVKYTEERRVGIEKQIKTTLGQITTMENAIKLKNEEYKIMADRERQLIEEIRDNKADSSKLMEKREALFSRKEGKDDIATLLYTTTLQQNMGYITGLQNELSNLRTRKETILNGIEQVKNSIAESRGTIKDLDLSTKETPNIVVLQEPLVSLRPVWPKKKQIVSFGGLIGLMIGFLIVIFIEQRESIKSRFSRLD
jgi:uncharacterized protein involved in exopolysaccharide biosynthesis